MTRDHKTDMDGGPLSAPTPGDVTAASVRAMSATLERGHGGEVPLSAILALCDFALNMADDAEALATLMVGPRPMIGRGDVDAARHWAARAMLVKLRRFREQP